MAVCGSCGATNPEGARFCNGCGSPLSGAQVATHPPAAAPPPPAAAVTQSREERRVVTVVFSDLAGFTSRSETLDPEDARALLVPYYAILEHEITSHGGVVERHIGDGIMALFGAPVAHEDDPERAIRAALRILERIPALGTDLHARIGINTGEILFRSEGAGREDAVTGDAANTAARLQGLAPVDGVVVGEPTWRATSRVFEYTEHPEATVKGKAEPIRVFQPMAPRARLGTDLLRTDAPYVGRSRELAAMAGVFEASVAGPAVRLVTVVGDPGMGKSRLVGELLAHAQASTPNLTWRQGRCLPYGDGVTFWALGEIVKAQTGTLESDDPATASTKINDAIAEGLDRDWLRQRLLPLLGVEAGVGAEREEQFAAWEAFLVGVAAAGPTVLVFEDLHWADDAMLEFIEHLARSTAAVPLLLVATTRPPLLDHNPEFPRGVPGAVRLDLHPLSGAETAELVAALLGAVVPAELVAPLLERAEGNPLYAEEYVRLLTDRDLLTAANGAVQLKPGAALPVPESITALLAARLDTLPIDHRALLGDASVVGKVFWSGGVAAIGGRARGGIDADLDALSRKDLVRPARRSSMAGEREFAFWHVLARDVAYGQLPRAARAAKHVAAARWLEGRAGERVEDIAELLAHHWVTALELTRAAGQVDHAASIEPEAIRSLLLSASKAGRLDLAAGAMLYDRALALTPPGHPQRPDVLARYAKVASDLGRSRQAAALCEEALPLLRARGDLEAALGVMRILSAVLLEQADPRAWVVDAERVAIAEALPPSRAVFEALVGASRGATMLGRHDDALELLDRAIRMGRNLALPNLYEALGSRGWSRCAIGDRAGLDDLREAIDLATRAEDGPFVVYWQNNLAVSQLPLDGPGAADATLQAGLALARSRGLEQAIDVILGSTALTQFWLGSFDAVLSTVAAVEERLDPAALGRSLSLGEARSYEVKVNVARGLAERVMDRLEDIEATVRGAGDAEYLAIGLAASTLARLRLGQRPEARSLLREIAANHGTRKQATYAFELPGLVRAAIELDDIPLARQLVSGLDPVHPAAEHALTATAARLAEADNDPERAAAAYADAATRWESFSVPYEHGLALLGRGRCLITLGRDAEAAGVLERAIQVLGDLGAEPAGSEARALILPARAGS